MVAYEATRSLSVRESALLRSYESIVEGNLKGFLQVGVALTAIRNARLYREHYKTFRDYCERRWGRSSSWARQIIQAARVVEDLKGVTDVTPTSDIQCRPLAPLDTELRREVWTVVVRKAHGRHDKITGPLVQQTVAELVKAGAREAGTEGPKPSELLGRVVTAMRDAIKASEEWNVDHRARDREAAKAMLGNVQKAVRDFVRN